MPHGWCRALLKTSVRGFPIAPVSVSGLGDRLVPGAWAGRPVRLLFAPTSRPSVLLQGGDCQVTPAAFRTLATVLWRARC
jgi:hypothetical protein